MAEETKTPSPGVEPRRSRPDVAGRARAALPAEVLAVPAKAGRRKFFRRKRFAILRREDRSGHYKDVRLLRSSAESGKITPRRLTGVCTPLSGVLSRAISRRGYRTAAVRWTPQ